MCLTCMVLGCSGLDSPFFLRDPEKSTILFLEASVSYNTSVDIIMFKIYFYIHTADFPEAKDVICYISV